jgi:hypothetical protein
MNFSPSLDNGSKLKIMYDDFLMVTWRSASLYDFDALSKKLNESAVSPILAFELTDSFRPSELLVKYAGSVHRYHHMEADLVENDSVVTHN